MPVVYFQSNIPNQMKGVLTRPSSGLNEYSPPASLNENYMSDLLDVLPYRNEGIQFFDRLTDLSKFHDVHGLNKGIVLSALATSESTADAFTYFVLSITSTTLKITRVYYSETLDSSYTWDTDAAIPADYKLAFASSVIFKTEAEEYYVFTISNNKFLYYINHTATDTYGKIDLPFYPKKMLAHANRIFIIDEKNKLWWCRAGDLFSWYTTDFDDDAIFASTNMKGTAYTITNQPNVARPVTLTHTVTDTPDTVGTMALVGSFQGVAQTETLTPSAATGRIQSLKVYDVITSLTPSGWVQGGATPDTISMGWGPVGAFVQEDAGYWTVEREPMIHDMCLLSDNIYLFGSHNIYVFQGYSYDTFSLQQAVANVGITPMYQPCGYNDLAVVKNMAYFLYDSEVYEYDGNNQPMIISRPVIVNDSVRNGMMGGIDLPLSTGWVLAADLKTLYLYKNGVNSTSGVANISDFFYQFDFETRTWWKQSGILNSNIKFNSVAVTDEIFVRYVPTYGMSSSQPMLTIITQINTVPDWYFGWQLSCKATSNAYIETKAYSTNPSEIGTLTAILLMIGGTASTTANIIVSYSLTEDAVDFAAIKTYTALALTGDVQILTIPVPVAYIANAHHYRIKIEIDGSVYLYNIERRFRIRGRSR